jgi:transposase
MAKAKTVVGLDVHATKIVAAVLDVETGELSRFAMTGDAGSAAGSARGCRGPRASGDRVKTDRRDAEQLVRLLLDGKLHPVRVPGDEEEALRDLVRAREQVRVVMRSRHRLSKLLLRHGIRFDEGKAWTDRHRAWLKTITLPWPAAQSTLLDVHGDRRDVSPAVTQSRCRAILPSPRRSSGPDCSWRTPGKGSRASGIVAAPGGLRPPTATEGRARRGPQARR